MIVEYLKIKIPRKHAGALSMLLISIFIANVAFAQNQLEFAAASAPTTNTGLTQGPTVATFLRNTTLNTNSFVAYNPTLTATFTLSNQQFTQPGLATGVPVNIGSGGSQVGMLSYSDGPTDTDYSTDQFDIGTGIKTSINYGVHIATYSWALTTAGILRTSRPYMADLTVTFNRPVNNPILHFVGFGGFAGATAFTTELELQTPNITLTKLSGNANLDVSNNKILNNRAVPGSNAKSAGGSIMAAGNGITSMLFKIYLRGDGSAGTAWGSSNTTGDDWAIGISFPSPQIISGNLFDDANGLSNNSVDGSGTNLGGTMYANLVDDQDNVIGSTAIANNGSYSFSEVFTGTQTVQISTIAGVKGSAAPSQNLPTEWANTGENIGTAAGNDGNADGTLTVNIAQAPITNINFGIDQLPTAYTVFAAIETPNHDAFLTLNDKRGTGTPTPLQGSDPEDQPAQGDLTNKKIAIVSLPTNGQLYYNGAQISFGDDNINPPSSTNPKTIAAYNQDLLQVKFTYGSYISTAFQYSYVDLAGKISSPATYTITWALLLPIKLKTFEAISNGCQTNLAWETTEETTINGFELQASQDGIHFTTISYLACKHNADGSKYSFVYFPENNNTYYRLQIVALTGAIISSNAIAVQTSCKENTDSVYPNPVADKLVIHSLKEGCSINLYNTCGQLVNTIKTGPGGAVIDMNKLATGSYFLTIKDKNQQRIKTVTVIKQ